MLEACRRVPSPALELLLLLLLLLLEGALGTTSMLMRAACCWLVLLLAAAYAHGAAGCCRMASELQPALLAPAATGQPAHAQHRARLRV
jgi:hypothetical protein